MLFELCLQIPDVPEGACSFCLPGDVTPELFSHQSWGSTVTFQLSSHWANSKFLGFFLCAVIAFGSVSHSLQVKCTYHFRKKHGDSHDLIAISMVGMMRSASTQHTYSWDLIHVWLPKKKICLVNTVRSQLNSNWKI